MSVPLFDLKMIWTKISKNVKAGMMDGPFKLRV